MKKGPRSSAVPVCVCKKEGRSRLADQDDLRFAMSALALIANQAMVVFPLVIDLSISVLSPKNLTEHVSQ